MNAALINVKSRKDLERDSGKNDQQEEDDTLEKNYIVLLYMNIGLNMVQVRGEKRRGM